MASRPTLAKLLELLKPFDSEEEREEARQRLLELGESYQADVEEDSAAPRRGEVTAELAAIAKAARALRELLWSANPHTIGTLEGAIGSTSLLTLATDDGLWPGELGRLREAADISSGTMSGWRARLAALEDLSREVAQPIPIDTGGRANVFTDRHGPPKWRVAEEAFSLFARWDPGPYVVDGPLLEFAAAVLECVSEGRESGETIRPYLQQVARDAREWHVARKRSEELADCLTNLRRICSQEQLEPIEREWNEAMRRVTMGSDRPRNLRARRAQR